MHEEVKSDSTRSSERIPSTDNSRSSRSSNFTLDLINQIIKIADCCTAVCPIHQQSEVELLHFLILSIDYGAAFQEKCPILDCQARNSLCCVDRFLVGDSIWGFLASFNSYHRTSVPSGGPIKIPYTQFFLPAPLHRVSVGYQPMALDNTTISCNARPNPVRRAHPGLSSF